MVEDNNIHDDLALIYRGTFLEVENVKDLLEHNGIYVVLEEIPNMSITPFAASSVGETVVNLYANKEDKERALQIIQKEYEEEKCKESDDSKDNDEIEIKNKFHRIVIENIHAIVFISLMAIGKLFYSYHVKQISKQLFHFLFVSISIVIIYSLSIYNAHKSLKEIKEDNERRKNEE